MTGNTRKRSFGLAAILVIGTIAGFLVAAGTSGAEYATVGTVSDSQAFQMPVEEEDQRVRFALDADQATADEPTASFALYDASGEFFTEFALAGDGDDAEAILDQPGSWVLFVTDRNNAELTVQYEGEDAEDAQLEQIPVEEERTVVADQDGGALDEQVAFRVDQRPAAVFLEYSGDIEGLDATVASDEGPVYELSDARANTTGDETVRGGEATFTSSNLAAGTYDVQASAGEFDGELVFVEQTFEPQQTPAEPEPTEENVTTYTDENDGEVVAEVTEGEAVEVGTASSSELVFLTDARTDADLMVYNDSDRLVEQVEIGHSEDYDWGEQNEGEERSNATVTTVELPSAGTYVVYADEVSPEKAPVNVFVPAADAPAAEELEVKTQQATLDGNEDAWNTTMDGALVEISAHTRDVAGMERNVTATGDAGTVLHYEQSFNSFGATTYSEHAVYPEAFTDGDLEVTMDGNGIGGQTDVEIVHYVR